MFIKSKSRLAKALDITHNFGQEPGPAVRLIDPGFNQADGSDITVLFTDLVRGQQEPRKFPVVPSEICQHFLRAERLLIVVIQPLMLGNIANGVKRGSPDFAPSFP